MSRFITLAALLLASGCLPKAPPRDATLRFVQTDGPSWTTCRAQTDGTQVQVFDDAGRLKMRFRDELGVPEEMDVWEYSDDGRTAHRRSPREQGHVIEVYRTTLDGEGRLIRHEQTGPTARTLAVVERDEAGHVVAYEGPDGSRVFQYDEQGRLIGESPDITYVWEHDGRSGEVVRFQGGKLLDSLTLDEHQRVVRRVKESDPGGRPVIWTEYTYDDTDFVLEERWSRRDLLTDEVEVRTTSNPRDSFGNGLWRGTFRCIEEGTVEVALPEWTHLSVAGTVENGLRVGTWIARTRTGTKVREIDYEAGLPTRLRNYFPDGTLYEEGALELGLRAGTWERYWANGTLRERGTYDTGTRRYPFEQWSEEGEPLAPIGIEHVSGQNAENESVSLHFGLQDQSTYIRSELHKENGIPHGTWESWHPNGVLEKRERRWCGALLSETHWSDDGEVVRHQVYRPEGFRIGAGLVPLSPEESRALGLAQGLRVDNVFEGLPADLAGLKAGDVVLSVGGTAVGTREDFIERLGAVVRVQVLRDGARMELEVAPLDLSTLQVGD